MSANTISEMEALLKSNAVIPLPDEPEPTGDATADYNAYKVWEATVDRIKAHNRRVRFGAQEAAEAKARAEKLAAEKGIRDAALARYKESGNLADSFAVALYQAMLAHFGDARTAYQWISEAFLMTGPTTDAPEGHSKGSRTMKRLAFPDLGDGKGAREVDLIFKDVKVDQPQADESGDSEPDTESDSDESITQ